MHSVLVRVSKRASVVNGTDTNGTTDVFLTDRTTGATVLVSRQADQTGPAFAAANDSSTAIDISADGRFVLFGSNADNLVAGQSASFFGQVFVFDRDTGTSTLVSRQSGMAAIGGDDNSTAIAISDDGNFVLFNSDADNLVAGQTPSADTQAFLFDRAAGSTILVSRASMLPGTAGNDASVGVDLSADGRFVLFNSEAIAVDSVLAEQVEPTVGATPGRRHAAGRATPAAIDAFFANELLAR